MNVRAVATSKQRLKWTVHAEGIEGWEQGSYTIHKKGMRFCVYRHACMVGDYPSLQSAVDEIKALMGFA